MKEYFDLFLTFARIGGFTFGGGYAMLPMMQRELVEKKQWTTNEELLNYYVRLLREKQPLFAIKGAGKTCGKNRKRSYNGAVLH